MSGENRTREFVNTFSSLCRERNSWQVWTDFITAAACSIANAMDTDERRHDKREQEYSQCIERLGGVENGAKLFAIVVNALEENPAQDFLGELFMNLGLGNNWKGQFFTPYNICEMMVKMDSDWLKSQMKEKGWISVHDPACGAGATLIATANVLYEQGINYQREAFFVAQDVDRLVGLMCYIQLSLLGCPGYVVIADTLAYPITGNILFPDTNDKQELWYTPMYHPYVFNYRNKHFKEVLQ